MIEHQSDIAVELEAPDRAGLFQAGLEALTALLTEQTDEKRRSRGAAVSVTGTAGRFEVKAEGFDDEERLVGILNELLFACQVERWLPGAVESLRFETRDTVTARMRGFAGKGGANLSRDIKAATYHGLRVEPGPPWRANVVFDV